MRSELGHEKSKGTRHTNIEGNSIPRRGDSRCTSHNKEHTGVSTNKVMAAEVREGSYRRSHGSRGVGGDPAKKTQEKASGRNTEADRGSHYQTWVRSPRTALGSVEGMPTSSRTPRLSPQECAESRKAARCVQGNQG